MTLEQIVIDKLRTLSPDKQQEVLRFVELLQQSDVETTEEKPYSNDIMTPLPKETRSLEEIIATMNRLRWTPPPNSPSTTELIREDRDR